MGLIIEKITNQILAFSGSPDQFDPNLTYYFGKGDEACIAQIEALVDTKVPTKYWVIDGENKTAREMDADEKTAKDAAVALDQAAALADRTAAAETACVALIDKAKGLSDLSNGATVEERLRALELTIFGA